MIKMLLVDDHELVRTGYRHIFAKAGDIRIVGEATSGEEGVQLARKLKPDVVIMDVHLPGMSGLQATERIMRIGANIAVIVVSMQNEQPFPRKLLAAGANGYLTKNNSAEELIRAVRCVASGQTYIAGQIAQAMALESLPGNAGECPFDHLSKRELEIVIALLQGKSMEAIAARLNLSAKTVATYKYRAMGKLNVENQVGLVHLANRHGILQNTVKTTKAKPR